jgi:hypothetical protein
VVLALEGGVAVAGDTLRVGSPLVAGLSADDLGIALAHGMTETGQRADRAARAMAADDTEALTALIRADALTWHFMWYLLRYLTTGPAPGNLLADWLETVSRPVPPWATHAVVLSGLEAEPGAHPGFAFITYSTRAAVKAAALTDGLAAAPGTAITDRIAPADALALTSQLDADPDDSPATDYIAVERDILRATATLTRHGTIDDVVDLIGQGRGPALADCWHETAVRPGGAGLPDDWTTVRATGPPTTGELLEALIAARAAHDGRPYDGILNPGRLRAPDTDIYRLITRALATTPIDLAGLRPLL